MIKILFIASEADPLIKVGGLGDVAGSLPMALKKIKYKGETVDIRLALPYHPVIRQKYPNVEQITAFSIQTSSGPVSAQIHQMELNGLPIYLINGSPIPQDAPVYSLDTRQDGWKYTFFSIAALEMTRHLDWQPDIIHANDWHTAVSVVALARQKQEDPFFANTHSVFTIHNLPFMGAGTEAALDAFGIAPSRDVRLPIWARQFPLPLGLLYADHIVAVSPSYAHEIMTPEFGCGLEGLIQSRSEVVSGILNGLDTQAWDPSTDKVILNQYSKQDLTPRLANKLTLEQEVGLKPDAETPLLILISRMDQQKGVDIAIEGLRQTSDIPWKAILLGTGDPNLEQASRRLEVDFPDRVRTLIRFDANLSRRMYSGGDIILMPSRYEPCGLAQMIAMRYGCVPLARSVGGLTDTIRDAADLIRGNGFLFDDPTPEDFSKGLRRAAILFGEKAVWSSLQYQGMQSDFSWHQSAVAYLKIYQSLEERHG